jgi:hypothetical protein
MRKLCILAFILFFPITSYCQPSIVFNEESYDFGTITQGDEIEHTFEFTNSGDQDLIIAKLVTS